MTTQTQKPRAVFCWSGGKDSAFALYKILQDDEVEVVALITTLNTNHRRISMHGVREELLDIQAASIGLPLEKVWVSEGTNEEYEQLMAEKFLLLKESGISIVCFGDIFLEDLRLYREQMLARVGLQAAFPLWKIDTRVIINDFLASGFHTITCCVSNQHLAEDFVGKPIDTNFIQLLPEHVDVCGENGEFHTFCYEGPIFKTKIHFKEGEKLFRPISNAGEISGFWYIDLIPVN